MTILQRVTKAAKETGEVRNHDPEAIARAAIATMFNWLSDSHQPAIDAAVVASHSDAETCRRVWATMVSELRREAGF